MDKKRDKLLFDNKWISTLIRDNWYVYTHNVAGDGKGVMVLVYDFSDPGNLKILSRYETTVCHEKGYHPKGKPNLNLTSITGMCDKKGKSEKEIAVEELKEEAGIVAESSELEELGFVYPSKGSDTEIFLFALDGSKKSLGSIEGDGTIGEKDAYVEWKPASFVIEKCNDPMMGMAFVRLVTKKTREHIESEK